MLSAKQFLNKQTNSLDNREKFILANFNSNTRTEGNNFDNK